MLEGVLTAKNFLLILTAGIFERPYCRLEMRAAVLLNRHRGFSTGTAKTFFILWETDKRSAGYGGEIGDYIEQCKLHCPDLSRPLFEDCEAMPMQRESYLQKSLIDEVCRRSGPSIAQAPPPVAGDYEGQPDWVRRELEIFVAKADSAVRSGNANRPARSICSSSSSLLVPLMHERFDREAEFKALPPIHLKQVGLAWLGFLI
jgi:hypothetical protein